ncbi:response regulator [Thiohalorhabdus methylotrophus]|uniref:Response regulator n=1 Tax=Thiohalorhabdus methylotrophus TaxID=3242694 RepID=A0ABV4U1K1_9GAMM
MTAVEPGAEGSHILVVDDHREIRELLSEYLERQGYRVSVAADGEAARRVLREAALDLVVLDIMMPGEDGLSLCRHLRATTELPVIFLTAVAEDTDRVIGLELGADDYLTKPFNPRELLARVKAVLRRTNSLPPQRSAGDAERIAFGGRVLDVAQREVVGPDGVALPLSTGEFNLLMAFLDHPRVVLSRDQLLDRTRGREAGAYDRSIDNQVSRLRRKIEADPAHPGLIKTIWGAGYQFTADPERL